MTHEEIQQREVAESYVRGKLRDSERVAFEDHYFGCAACFEEVEVLQKFVAGVRHPAPPMAAPAPRAIAPRWYWPALVAVSSAAVLLSILGAWFGLVERPRLLAKSVEDRIAADEQRRRVQLLEKELELAKLAMARPPLPRSLPLVMPAAGRASSAAAVLLPPDADLLVIWVEPPASPVDTRYRLELYDSMGNTLETVDGLLRNAYGALAASVPASRLPPGAYRTRLFKDAGPLAGEYRFEVQR